MQILPLMNWLRMIQECFVAAVPYYHSSLIAAVKVYLSSCIIFVGVIPKSGKLKAEKTKDCCETHTNHAQQKFVSVRCQNWTGEGWLLLIRVFPCLFAYRISKSWSIKSYFKKLQNLRNTPAYKCINHKQSYTNDCYF